MDVDLCSVWEKSVSVESKWRHDVPWSWQCFSAHEEVDLPKNSGVLQLAKLGLFWGHLFAAECALVGCDTIRIDLISHGPISP